MKDSTNKLGQIRVAQRMLNINELEDKVRFAIEAYKRAYDRYKRGVDSTNDWTLVVRALTREMDEIKEYIAVAHHNIGVLHASRENYELAIESFNAALSFNPQYPAAHHNIGVAYHKIGDILNGEKHLEEAKRLGYEPKKK
jgi:tetratricopeptide (TPR) repeat protein